MSEIFAERLAQRRLLRAKNHVYEDIDQIVQKPNPKPSLPVQHEDNLGTNLPTTAPSLPPERAAKIKLKAAASGPKIVSQMPEKPPADESHYMNKKKLVCGFLRSITIKYYNKRQYGTNTFIPSGQNRQKRKECVFVNSALKIQCHHNSYRLLFQRFCPLD